MSEFKNRPSFFNQKMATPTSPLSALGLVNPIPPTNPSFWSFEKLSILPPDRIVATLHMIPGMLEAKTINLDTILPVCVKFCASHNSSVKKSSCEALICCSERYSRPDVGLLAVNILMKDLKDPNPDVRATAVDTIASLSLIVDEHSLPAISCGLKDSNPRVRKATVVGCGKVWRHSPKIIENNGIVDILYTMVRDPDPSVMTFSLQTINVILANEGGVVINSAMAQYLLSRLDDCQELEQCFLLDYLHRHKPKKTNARLAIMNHIDPLMGSKSAPVYLAASKLFYKIMITDVETKNLSPDFVDRFQPQLSRFMRDPAGNVEFQAALLEFVLEMSQTDVLVHLVKHHKDFRLRPKDRQEICLLKCQVMTKLCTSNHNQNESNEEMVKYLISQLEHSSVGHEVKTAILKALCQVEQERKTNLLVPELLKLVNTNPESSIPMLVKNARILPVEGTLLQQVCEFSLTYCALDLDLNNILWIICHHGHLIETSPYILEHIIGSASHEVLKDNLQLLLLTGVKVFLKSPAESQHVLGCIFRTCNEVGTPDMVDKVAFYSNLLQHQQSATANLC